MLYLLCQNFNIIFLERLTFEDLGKEDEEEAKKVIIAEPHVIPSRGPYLFNEPKK